ncbi:glutaredoxin domain-containing protein [Tsukamurella hominis]|uniref:glutaredoxin domain-containing protein n=1 Tax=Tsukamurella hominis TaxID=1970232 RepID=UPI0039EA19D2
MRVTVYSNPECGQCFATQRALEKAGIEFRHVDLSTDETARNHLSEQGYSTVPLVEVDGEILWTGFRPERIDKLAQMPTAAEV